jgi:hypothetical protein
MVDFFQKLFTREVVGEVTGVTYANRGIFREPVTLYTVTDDEGVIYRCGLLGHHSEIGRGDRVAMRLRGASLW